MAVNREIGSALMLERYNFDFKMCSFANGWAQVDTKQDASYYGTWTNPVERRIFNFCEGDTHLTVCDTDEEYKEELYKLVVWNREHNYWLGIDAGLHDDTNALRKKFIALGLEELLH